MELSLSLAEENYLKAIWHLDSKDSVSTNDLAELMSTKASSVTDMLKRLSKKDLIKYEKYKGAALTNDGEKIAIKTVRKHRLWRCF